MWTIGKKKEFGTYGANMIFDEKGEAILMVYGISQNTMLEGLNKRDAEGLAIARQVVDDHNTISALRKAGDKMKAALEDIKLGNDLYGADVEAANAAIEAWEAANKQTAERKQYDTVKKKYKAHTKRTKKNN